jgi:hypothetical protein
VRFVDHRAESLRLFRAECAEVHRWLDEFDGAPEYGMRHRRVRHHLAGIREVVQLFGSTAALIARRHIISDLKTEGWTEAD